MGGPPTDTGVYLPCWCLPTLQYGSNTSCCQLSKRRIISRKEAYFRTKESQAICEGCAELDGRCIARLILVHGISLNPVVRAMPGLIPLHENFRELERSAENGCFSCRVWRKLLLSEACSDDIITQLRSLEYLVFGQPPIATSSPWIATIETRSSNDNLLKAGVVLENRRYEPEDGMQKEKLLKEAQIADFQRLCQRLNIGTVNVIPTVIETASIGSASSSGNLRKSIEVRIVLEGF